MDKKTFQAPAILTRVGTLSDGGLSLNFHTQELSNEEKALLMEYNQKYGWLLFKENIFEEVEIPKDNAPSDEQKSPSQRLRAVVFLLSKQKGILPEKFEEYYRKIMEGFINNVKDKLQ